MSGAAFAATPDAFEAAARAMPGLSLAARTMLLGLADTARRRSRVFLAAHPQGGLAALNPQLPYLFACRWPVGDDEALLGAVADTGIALLGTLGEPGEARRFAIRLSAASGRAFERGMHMGCYALQGEARAPAAPGHLRAATAGDAAVLADWAEAFAEEVKLPPHETAQQRERSAQLLAEGRYWVWDHEGPRSHVALAATPAGYRIQALFTAPDARGRGYGGAALAALCKQLQTRGALGRPASSDIALFTDLANPTSNALYTRTGFVQQGEQARYDLR